MGNSFKKYKLKPKKKTTKLTIKTQLIDYQSDFRTQREKIILTFEDINKNEIPLEDGLNQIKGLMNECANIVALMEEQIESEYMKKEHMGLANKLKELKKEVNVQTEKLTLKLLM